MWVLATSRDSGLEGASPELVDIGGPRRSHRILQQQWRQQWIKTEEGLLTTFYRLSSRLSRDRDKPGGMVRRAVHALFGLRQTSCAGDACCYTLLRQSEFCHPGSNPVLHTDEHGFAICAVFYVDGFITGGYKGYKRTKEHGFAIGAAYLVDATSYQRHFGSRMDFSFLVDLLDGFLSYPRKTHWRELCGFGICIPHELTRSRAGRLDDLETIPYLDRWTFL